MVSGQLLDQLFRPGDRRAAALEVADPPGHRQPDLPRRPAWTGFRWSAASRSRMPSAASSAALAPSVWTSDSSRAAVDQRGLWSGPRRGGRHPPEAVGERAVATRFDELADRELIEDQPGRERPVAGGSGLPDGFAEPVHLIPPGSAPVQVGHLARAFEPELQAQDLREQRVVAVPAVPERLDERVGSRQGRGQLAACSSPVSSLAMSALTRFRMLVLSSRSRMAAGWLLSTSSTR